jgi:hypothetical protein
MPVSVVHKLLGTGKHRLGIGRIHGGRWRAAEEPQYHQLGRERDRHQDLKQHTEHTVVCLSEDRLPADTRQQRDCMSHVAGCHALGGFGERIGRCDRDPESASASCPCVSTGRSISQLKF